MKFLILTVLLVIMQTSPPVPPKGPDSTAKTSQNVQKNGGNNQVPATKTPTTVNPGTPKPDQNPNNPPTTQDTEQSVRVREFPPVSVKKDWSDRAYWIFSGFLALVGGFQVWLLWRTLGAIKRQADIMDKQKGVLERSVKAAEDSAIAAKDGAEATKTNIEMLVSKERARLVVDLRELKLTPRPFDVYTVDFTVSIHGATAAYVIETGCAAYFSSLEAVCAPETGNSVINSLSLLPKVISPNASPSEQFAIWRFGKENADDIISDIRSNKLFIGIRGYIKYKDVFDRERETRFRYVWKYLSLQGMYGLGGDTGDWQPCGSPDDNKNT